jgi:hypothetical protein
MKTADKKSAAAWWHNCGMGERSKITADMKSEVTRSFLCRICAVGTIKLTFI